MGFLVPSNTVRQVEVNGPRASKQGKPGVAHGIVEIQQVQGQKMLSLLWVSSEEHFAHIKHGNLVLWLRHYSKSKIKRITGYSQESQVFQVTSELILINRHYYSLPSNGSPPNQSSPREINFINSVLL